MSEKFLSLFVERGIPKFVAEENQQFANFIKAYFEYLEKQVNGEYTLIASFLENLDIDESVDDFLAEHKKQYANKFPEKYVADLRLLIKQIRNFYRMKGTEKSYEVLFSILFDTFVQFYYPKQDILRCSDGKWTQPYILVSDRPLAEVAYFNDKAIVGSVSGANGYVGSVIAYTDPNDGVTERFALKLSERLGDFVDSDVITVDGETVPTLTLVPNGVVVEQGEWVGSDGFISWDKKIQDNDYYQEFSYVLKTSLSKDDYDKIVKELVHPAGFKLFGDVKYIDSKAYAITDMQIVDIIMLVLYTAQQVVSLSDMAILDANDSMNIRYEKYKQRAGLTAFDWKYADTHKETDPYFSKIFNTIGAWAKLPISYVTSNYPENFVSVTVNGTAASGWSLENDKLIMNAPIAQTDEIQVTFSLTGNTYKFNGNGTAEYLLPEMSKQFYHIPTTSVQII